MDWNWFFSSLAQLVAELDRTVAVTEHGCDLRAVEHGEVKEIRPREGGKPLVNQLCGTT